MVENNTPLTQQTDALLRRIDEFEGLMRAFITQEVKSEIRRAEPEITLRITEAVTGKVNAMLEDAAESRLQSYEAALNNALAEMRRTNVAHGDQMTLAFQQAIGNFESRMSTKMEAVSRMEGASTALTQVIDGFRRDTQDTRRELSEVRTVATDTETRIREAYHAQDKKLDDSLDEMRETLAPLRFVFGVLKKPKNLAILVGTAGSGAGILKFIEVLTNFVSSGGS